MKSKTIVPFLLVLVVAFAVSAFSSRQDAPKKDEIAELKEQVKQIGDQVNQLEKNNKYLQMKVAGLELQIRESKTPKLIPLGK